MEKPFPAYTGKEPYLFVSYSHEDQQLVFSELAWLFEAGFNLWYDEGIHVGSVWRESIANALADSSGCIFFLTRNSALSENCLREIHFALEEGIKVVTVRIDDTPLSRQLKFALSDRQALVRDEHNEADFRASLFDALTFLTVRGPARVLEPSAAYSRLRTQIPIVCINPFANRENDDELNFFSRNLGTDIARCLYSASFDVTEGQLADVELDAQAAGRKHRAQYILNGTLVRIGNHLRASARLVETQQGRQVWANNFEPTTGNLPESISEIAEKIAAEVSFVFYQPEFERLKDVPEAELDAWGLSILSMSLPFRDAESAYKSRHFGELAVERDNEFAEAHANLADVIVSTVIGLFSKDVESDSRKAIEHSNKALVLNKDAVYVLNRCSRVHRVFGNASLALQLARRVESVHTYTLYPALIVNGKSEEVINDASVNPKATHSWVSDAFVIVGNHDDAEAWIRTSVARAPGAYLGWLRLANILGHMGKIDEGLDTLDKAQAVSPPGWTSDSYHQSLRLNWRNKDELTDPLFSGIERLTNSQLE